MNKAIDPRTKLLILIFLGLTVAWQLTLPAEILILLLLCVLFYSDGRKKGAVKLLAAFVVLVLIDQWLPRSNAALMSVHTLAHVVRAFMLPFAGGSYLIYSTQVSEIMTAFEKMHIPSAITISLVVMLRYLPSVREDYQNIKSAMKMRGIETGVRVLKHPLISAEYILVPLLSGSSSVADELSQAAYTKGIDIAGKKERYMKGGFGLADGAVLLYIALLCVGMRGKLL